MNITEHKLDLIRQIDELPKELLFELDKVIAQFQSNAVKKSSLSILLASWDDLDEDFPEIDSLPPMAEDIF
jgi:hypothetical protein